MSEESPVALVTGGARRIGAALCHALHTQGYRIVLHCHHSIETADALARSFNRSRANSAVVVRADVCQSDGLERLAQEALQRWQRLDVLINNASTYYPTPIGQVTKAHWQDLIGSNLKAPFFLSQSLAPALGRSQGCIINLSDINARKPLREHTLYCIAKAGNEMLTRSLALELAPRVRVNGIAPGAILWPESSDRTEVAAPEKLATIPLQRLGGAEAIVSAALFLIQQAPYLTGEIITVDGGARLT